MTWARIPPTLWRAPSPGPSRLVAVLAVKKSELAVLIACEISLRYFSASLVESDLPPDLMEATGPAYCQ